MLFRSAGYKKNIDYSNIIKERAIICICYKWEDEKEVSSLTWDNNQDDKKMLEKFVKVANTADELAGHNGERFDLAWVRTRCLFHRIPMFPAYTIIDTLKIARGKFRFNSNRLNYIADFLGLGQKIKTEYTLWKDIILKKDKDAMDSMVKYCKKDVLLLEKVFKVIAPHTVAKTHYGVVFGQDRGSCPECGSDMLTKSKARVTASGLKKIQYICGVCHRYHTKSDK